VAELDQLRADRPPDGSRPQDCDSHPAAPLAIASSR
jgi:hypothetical protein